MSRRLQTAQNNVAIAGPNDPVVDHMVNPPINELSPYPRTLPPSADFATLLKAPVCASNIIAGER